MMKDDRIFLSNGISRIAGMLRLFFKSYGRNLMRFSLLYILVILFLTEFIVYMFKLGSSSDIFVFIPSPGFTIFPFAMAWGCYLLMILVKIIHKPSPMRFTLIPATITEKFVALVLVIVSFVAMAWVSNQICYTCSYMYHLHSFSQLSSPDYIYVVGLDRSKTAYQCDFFSPLLGWARWDDVMFVVSMTLYTLGSMFISALLCRKSSLAFILLMVLELGYMILLMLLHSIKIDLTVYAIWFVIALTLIIAAAYFVISYRKLKTIELK